MLILTLFNDAVSTVEIIYVTDRTCVEWLTLLLSIREVTGSNLGPDTGYPH
jgi:hypothetical protein